MNTIKRARGLTEEGRRALARYLADNLKDAIDRDDEGILPGALGS